MAFPKTSIDTCMIEFKNTDLKFYTMEKRPIYDESKGFWLAESWNSDENIVTVWYYDRVVRYDNKDCIRKTWYYRPTIQDVYYGRCGHGCCVKFNSDGSIYMNWPDGLTWYYGPLIDSVYEDVYDGYESDDESCERCRSWHCECGYGGSIWN